jgi:redox-sensitive bicupin YhaK (pirin superfamily)
MIVLSGNVRDLGDGFQVNRVLPQVARRALGPFVFFDYFGPVDFAPGKGLDVRPHPHIGLATVTYLFDGEFMHRDSLGSHQKITPGAVNWMTAGRGIVHSERTHPETRAAGHRVHGIQSWVGLPQAEEECSPSFLHVGAQDLPSAEVNGVSLHLIAGEAYGLKSPVPFPSPIFYVDAKFRADTSLDLLDNYEERGVFVVEGSVEIGGTVYERGAMVLFDEGETARIIARAPARVMLVGGAPLDGPRHIWWNFVSSSKEHIERAKDEWRANPKGHIADDDEFIPLPA